MNQLKKEEDEKQLQIMIEYPEMNKNFVIQCSDNAQIQNLQEQLSKVIGKPADTIFLRLHQVTLDSKTFVQEFCKKEQCTVLSLEVKQNGGFRIL